VTPKLGASRGIVCGEEEEAAATVRLLGEDDAVPGAMSNTREAVVPSWRQSSVPELPAPPPSNALK